MVEVVEVQKVLSGEAEAPPQDARSGRCGSSLRSTPRSGAGRDRGRPDRRDDRVHARRARRSHHGRDLFRPGRVPLPLPLPLGHRALHALRAPTARHAPASRLKAQSAAPVSPASCHRGAGSSDRLLRRRSWECQEPRRQDGARRRASRAESAGCAWECHPAFPCCTVAGARKMTASECRLPPLLQARRTPDAGPRPPPPPPVSFQPGQFPLPSAAPRCQCGRPPA